MTDRLTPEREAEIREWMEGPLGSATIADPSVVLELLAELAAVRKERDELEARSRRLITQWNERAETWAPLSSPENNRESFEHYRSLCSAYCEAADNLHNVLAGIDPDVPWHLRSQTGGAR